MNMKKVLVICFVLLLISCLKREYGNKIIIKEFTSVLQIKKYPENYLNQYVKIQGKVVEESSIGKWITLQDNYIIIMVNLNENFSELGKMLDKNIIVIGKFIKNKEGYSLDGRWIKIK